MKMNIVKVNAIGYNCPIPVVKAKKAIDSSKVGEKAKHIIAKGAEKVEEGAKKVKESVEK